MPRKIAGADKANIHQTLTLNISASLLTVKSISSGVLYLLNEKRTAPFLDPGYSAPKTCDPVEAPLEHALPPEADIPCKSRLKSSISFSSDSGRHTFNTVYKLLSRLAESPWNSTPGISCFSFSIILALSPV